MECVGQTFLEPFGWKSVKVHCKKRLLHLKEYFWIQAVASRSRSVVEEKQFLA